MVASPLIFSAPPAPIVVVEYTEFAERDPRTVRFEMVPRPETLKAF